MLNVLAALLRDEPQLCIAAIFLSISNFVPMLIDVFFFLVRCDGDDMAETEKVATIQRESDFKIFL
jgi:hypothetical protein